MEIPLIGRHRRTTRSMIHPVAVRVFASFASLTIGSGVLCAGVAFAEARNATRETSSAELRTDVPDAPREDAKPPRRSKPAKKASTKLVAAGAAKPNAAKPNAMMRAPVAKNGGAKTASIKDVAVTMSAANEKSFATKKSVNRTERRPTSRATREPTPEYRRMRDSWHAAIVTPEPILDEHGRPPLVIEPVNGNGMERVSLTPSRDDGGFDLDELKRAARAFTPSGMAGTHAVSAHLLDLVYRAMRHFHAPQVYLVSGYRRDRAGSRHSQGRAIDLVVPGVSNEQLAQYVRKLGFVGVGIYPKSGFIHLDVRETSFFWVDDSLPDERSRCNQILPEESASADLAALERGEKPDTFVSGNDREDKAAARAYQKRAANRRRAAASTVQNF
jgi:hypothetical protein